MTSDDFEWVVQNGVYIMEPKIDGWRMQFEVTPDRVQAWTRTNKDATGKMPYVERDLMRLTGGRHAFRLDGEAVYVDENGEPDYNLTARCLGSGTDVCVMKQREVGPLTYFVFDILAIDGHDIRGKSLLHRKSVMRRFLSSIGQVDLVLGTDPSVEQHALNYDQYKEGSVLKDFRSPYAGKRHKSWLKWKQVDTADVEIVGYKEGQGKFLGLIGAIQFLDPATQVVGYCSGMDDETRVYISDHRVELIGRTIEIKHYGRLVDGYRHPQFVRFRLDK